MDNLKRVLALAGVAVLLMCYVMSFVTGLMATEDSHNWFIASIGATILIPTVLYGYSIIVKMSNRNDQESKLREDAYLRLMKEQIQKEKEKQAAENANVEPVNGYANAEDAKVEIQNTTPEGQNISGQQIQNIAPEGQNTNGQQ